MSTVFEKFAPQFVTVGGEIRRRMDLTAEKILKHTDIDGCFASHYHNRSEKTDVPGGFTGYGMLLDAVVKAAANNIGGDAMRELKRHRIAKLLSTQDENGEISIFSDKPGFWDSHDQAYLIQALVLDHRYFGETASLSAAVRLADFLIGRDAAVTLGSETAFLLLAEESGEARFLEFCRTKFIIESDIDTYDRQLQVNGVAHVYTWVARVLAQLQYVKLTGKHDKKLLSGLHELYERVFHKGYSSVSGSCSGGFFWGELWDDTQIGLGKWGETCVSAYLLRCTAEMLTYEPESCYGDLYERIMYNAFFGAQSDDGLRQRYFIPFNEPGEWYAHETYCCPNNLRRMMFELPQAIYYKTGDGVAVNLYTDSTLQTEEYSISQKTCYPLEGTVELQICSAKAFTLRLRIPRWCSEAVIRNGTTETATPGWHAVPIEAGQSTAIRIEFPMPVRLIAGTRAQTGRVAVMRGPVVYAVEMKRNELTGHQMDLLTIDNTKPITSTGNNLAISCLIPNRDYFQKVVTFTRFSAENRTRTYFPILQSADSLVEDELFLSKKGV